MSNVRTIKAGWTYVNLCIKCGEPTSNIENVKKGDKPSARIICKNCFKEYQKILEDKDYINKLLIK